VKTIGELIAMARAQPGKLSFGSGNGSSRGGPSCSHHGKVDLLGVPYKTQPQAISDLLGGRIDVIFSDFTTGLPRCLTARARGLRSTMQEAHPGAFERFPTVDESGVPGASRCGRGRRPTCRRARPGHHRQMNTLVREAVSSEAYRNPTRTITAYRSPARPRSLLPFQASETKKWGEIVKLAEMQEP